MSDFSNIHRRLLLGGGLLAATAPAGPALAARRRRGGGAGDFAFLDGRWRVEHRRRLRPLEAESAWETCGGECVIASILGGLGSVDDHSIAGSGGGFSRAALRLFDPGRGLWSTRSLGLRPGDVGPRLVGRARDGGATFYGSDRFRGRPVQVRIRWSKTSADTLGWEQALSSDGGAEWRTVYAMTFSRMA